MMFAGQLHYLAGRLGDTGPQIPFLRVADRVGQQFPRAPDGKAGASKISVRAKVEHPFHVVKNLFRHRKTRYRGSAKNTAQLFTLFAFANLVLAGRRFTITESRSPS
jgi:hypothetical protein